MSYEELREQCAKVLDDMVDQAITDIEPISMINYFRNKAAEIRALPLPEVEQEPVAWVYGDANMGGGICEKLKWHRPEYKIKPPYSLGGDAVPLYSPPPDAEALRKENEKLRLAMIKCEQEADFALKQVSQTKICAAVRKIKELANTALKGG